MQFYKMLSLGLCFVVKNTPGNETFVVLNQGHCVEKSLYSSLHVADVLNKYTAFPHLKTARHKIH